MRQVARYTVMGVLFLFLSWTASSAAWLFTEVDPGDVNLSMEQKRLLKGYTSRPTTDDYRLVRVDFDLLRTEPTLDLGTAGESIPVIRTRIERRAEDDYSWFGKDPGVGNDAVLVAKGGRLTGTFYDGTLFHGRPYPQGYTVRFIGDGLHVVLTIDPTVGIKDDPPTDFTNPGNPPNTPPLCPVFTMMIAYTPAAAEQEGDIFGLAQLVTDEFNDVFENSQIGLHTNLVYIYETDYDEYEQIGHGNHRRDQTIDDLEHRFSGNGDGYMDEVHNYRNLAGADVVILIGDGQSPPFDDYEGKATQVVATADKAFAVANTVTASGPYWYTFQHEVAHLFGAKHDIDSDSSLEPFAYGHGFVHIGDDTKWRTVMAYNIAACGSFGGCIRLPYFSNPDVSIDGVPTGNNNRADNARVLEVRSCNVAGFREGVWH